MCSITELYTNSPIFSSISLNRLCLLRNWSISCTYQICGHRLFPNILHYHFNVWIQQLWLHHYSDIRICAFTLFFLACVTFSFSLKKIFSKKQILVSSIFSVFCLLYLVSSLISIISFPLLLWICFSLVPKVKP